MIEIRAYFGSWYKATKSHALEFAFDFVEGCQNLTREQAIALFNAKHIRGAKFNGKEIVVKDGNKNNC